MLCVLIRKACEVLLMSTHNICFHGEISKIFCGYPLLSGAKDNLFSVGFFGTKTYIVGTHWSLSTKKKKNKRAMMAL